jgi:transcriptional regulator with XRE-family HTH domain
MNPKPSRFEKKKPTPRDAEGTAKKRGPGRPKKNAPEEGGVAQAALDWGRVSLEFIAQELGVSRPTLAAYRTGERRLPPEVSRALAEWIRARSREGERLADQLEEQAASSTIDSPTYMG